MTNNANIFFNANKSRYGTLRSDTFTDSGSYSSVWTSNAPSSFTTSSTGLVVSGGTGNFSKYTQYNYFTCLEDWEIEGQEEVGTYNATSYGVAFGVENIAGTIFSSLLYLDSSGNNIIRHDLGNHSSSEYSGGSLPGVQLGSLIYYNIKRVKNAFTSLYRLGNNSVTLTTTGSYVGVPAMRMPTVSKFTIFSVGGTHTVKSFTIKSAAKYRPDYLFLGDSITSGYSQEALATRAVNQAIANSNRYVVLAGPGHKSADLVTYLSEAMALRPKKTVILIGINDVYNSVPNSTTIANIQTVVTGMESVGSEAIICKLLPCVDHDVNPTNNSFVTNFGAKVKVNYYNTSLLGTPPNPNATYFFDGLHPKANGGAIMATTLNNAGIS